MSAHKIKVDAKKDKYKAEEAKHEAAVKEHEAAASERKADAMECMNELKAATMERECEAWVAAAEHK
jgi:hypothetical protein